MPVGEPGINQEPRRIHFEHLAMVLESALLLCLHGHKMPFPAGTRIHFPLRDLVLRATAPLECLLAIADGVKHALGRGRDENLRDDGVIVTTNTRRRHSPSSFLR